MAYLEHQRGHFFSLQTGANDHGVRAQARRGPQGEIGKQCIRLELAVLHAVLLPGLHLHSQNGQRAKGVRLRVPRSRREIGADPLDRPLLSDSHLSLEYALGRLSFWARRYRQD